MTQAAVPDQAQTPAPPRWGMLRWIWILAFVGLLYVRLGGVDEGARSFLTVLCGVAGGFFSLVWLLLFSRLPWSARLKGLVAALALCLVWKALVRFDGFEGDTWPMLSWRWTPKKVAVAAFQPVSAPATAAPNDKPKEKLPDFLQYMGGQRNGIVATKLIHPGAGWKPKELWRQPVGEGWSGFVVAEGRALTQEQRGEDELVTCYDLLTGKPLWAHADKVRFSEAMGGDGPRATPVVENGRVYAQGATGILNCLELADGKLVWTRNVLKDAGVENLQWGKSNAPLLTSDLVVVTLGESKDKALAAFKKASGEPAWRTGHDKSSYSSPVLGTLAGREQIVNLYADSVAGHDSKTGEELWSYKWPGAPAKCANPVILDGDRVLVSSGYGIGSVLLKIKANEKGPFEVQELWKNLQMKSKFSNLPIKDGYIYGLDEGILECVELNTGQRTWKDGRYGYGQILLADDLLLVQAESGAFAAVEPNPKEYKEIARFSPLHAKTWNTFALAGPYLIVRNAEEAACYELPLRDSK